MDESKRRQKLEEFMNLYSRKIFNLFYYSLFDREEAKDLVQDVFFKVYKGLPKFKEESSPYTWIYKIAINTLRTYMRKQKIRKILSFDRIPEETHPGYDPPKKVPSLLYDALKKIPYDFKEVILLYYYDEYGVKEISEILGIPEGTVKSRLSRGRGFIKAYLEKRGFYGM